MRVWWFVSLLAIGESGVQPQPAANDVAVVVDADAPVANGAVSARLRNDALADLDRHSRPVYFELTAHAVNRVAANASESFRRAIFTFEPLRVPALVPYQGLVRDAGERIASRLSATFVALNDEQDVERVRHLLADDVHAAAKTPAAVAEVTTERLDPSVPAEAATGVDASDDVLRRAAAYVARFVQTFAAVIWREDYHQENRVRRKFNASGGSFYTTPQRRHLDSELLFVWLPAEATWIAVRDVIAIDGKARPAADRRLTALLSQSALSVGQLRQLATENGRFDIGRIVRTFNEPTLALLFLSDQYRQRFTFTQRSEELVNGRPAAAYDFAEHARPTVIQNQDRDVPARGTLWIDPESGRVLPSLLDMSVAAVGVRGRMTVVYRPDAKFDVLVPSEMRETYTSFSGDEVTTVATYSNFRRFETAARIIPDY